MSNAWDFPGSLTVNTKPKLEILAQFHGDPRSVSLYDVPMSRRVFIYSETDLSDADTLELHAAGVEGGHDIQFRGPRHAIERARHETPLAFISHDTRDKEVARKIAIGLQKMRCSVWYDEFTLRAGANLRDSIEKGLKECSKCIVVLSKNFFSNGGWTKKEFDSIFTREILEQTNLIIPIWVGVQKHDVYDYSPSLLNVKGLDWQSLGEQEVIRQACLSIVDRRAVK